MRRTAVILAALLATSILGCQGGSEPQAPRRPTSSSPRIPPPGNPVIGTKPPMPSLKRVTRPACCEAQVYASGLEVPWDMVFVSNSRAYVTERPGRVRLIENGKLQSKPYAVISAAAGGEGGLMGIALHPNYPDRKWVYLMYTYRDNGTSYNRVSRFTDTGNGLTNEVAVVTKIPAALYHDGGVIRFGPDGMLYVGTGDAGKPESAQSRSSLSGKILRMTPEGKVPSDNPFPDSLVYAYGFRNVQGLAWNPANGDLWATNHGPSGDFGLERMDSVYIVTKGGNYGWPRTLGVTKYKGVVPPVIFLPDEGAPPAGAMFYNGNLIPELKDNFFYATLRTEYLTRVVLSGAKITSIEKWFEQSGDNGVYGRLRMVVQGPDGALYVSTSNRDRRGQVQSGDDKILRIAPR